MNNALAARNQPTGPATAQESYMTRAEAANYVRLGVNTLAKLAMQGAGPAFCRIGHAVRYRRSDLDVWMAERLKRA